MIVVEGSFFMKKYVRMAAVLFCAAPLLCVALTGCGAISDITDGLTETDTANGFDSGTDASAVTDASQAADFAQSDGDMFTDRDFRTEYDDEESIHITLNGDSASADSDSVQISGSTVTLTEEAVYVISGTLDDGMVVVDADDTAKLQLVFDGVNINSRTSAPLYILEADKVFVTLTDGSENTLSNGGTFSAIDENNIDSVIFSKQDLTLNGGGALTVVSPAGHGIVCKDDLVITGGTYTVTSSSHALDANDSVRITGETALTANAGKDGIHSENNDDASLGFVYISGGTLDITSEGDGISAGAYMQIEGGAYQILAGGGSENGASESSDDWGADPGGMGSNPGSMGGTGSDPGSMGDGTGSNPGSMDSGTGSNPGSMDSGTGADPGNMTMESAGDSESSIPQNVSDTTAADTASEDSSTSMKGIKASGSMLIADGSFTIDSADDSVHSNTSITVNGGSFQIASGDDAFHADEALTVTSGTINISGCYEGLEALDLSIEGGDITLIATDDGLNAAGGTDSSGTEGGRDGMFGNMWDGNPGACSTGGNPGAGATAGSPGGMSSSNGSITISGGTLDITASGDGIDANGSVEITGGYIVVTGPTQGDTSTLDYDTTAAISGGTFIGSGGAGMAQTFSDSGQGVLSVSVGEQSAGTAVTIQDKDGNNIVSFEPEMSFAVVIVSSPEIESGETYTLTVGGQTGDIAAE